MLEDDFVLLSAFDDRCSAGVSLLIGCNLTADINLVIADEGRWLVVADTAVKSFAFRVVAVRETPIFGGWSYFSTIRSG